MTDIENLRQEADEVLSRIESLVKELDAMTAQGKLADVKLIAEQIVANAERLLKLTRQIQDLENPMV